jgi:hypothetical protein
LGEDGTEPKTANAYELRVEARRQRLFEASRRFGTIATALRNRASSMGAIIPLGQPILIGHHSERRDRRFRERIARTYERAFEADRMAEKLQQRAAAVGTAGISSDDPEAVVKLCEKLDRLETRQELMLAVNREIRRGGADVQSRLIALGLDAITAERAVMPDFAGRVGFPSYATQNNRAEIRRIKARIEELRAAATKPQREPVDGQGWRIEEDREENRVAISFDAIPSGEVRTRLKSVGFRWSPRRRAWVRKLNDRAWYEARMAMGVIATEARS